MWEQRYSEGQEGLAEMEHPQTLVVDSKLREGR
jgi:hypothetical protein